MGIDAAMQDVKNKEMIDEKLPVSGRGLFLGGNVNTYT